MQTTHSCKLCGSESTKLIYDFASDYITGDTFQVWQCQNCALAFTFPIPDDLSRYYPANYRRYNPLILNILKFFYRQRAKKWSNTFETPGIAFEMGCGDGFMLNTLRELGWQVIGSERTIQSAYFASHKLEIPIFVGGIECIHPAPLFNLVFLFQVLEHLDDPVGSLKQLSGFLKPNGKLIISVPNFAGWQSKISREKWFHLDVPRHLYHFSPASLEIYLQEVGLEIEKINYSSFEHDPFGWAQSLLNCVDHKHNRLTRLLMQIDKPNLMNFLHLIVGMVLIVGSVPLSFLSWLSKRGGIIEITAKKI